MPNQENSREQELHQQREGSKIKVREQEDPEIISLLESHGNLGMIDPTYREGARTGVYYGETRTDAETGQQYDKRVRYNVTDGAENDTLYASSETIRNQEQTDAGHKVMVVGQNLDTRKHGHAWTSKTEFDKNGNATIESGKTTGGENAGESYTKTFETDQHGPYARKSEINTANKFIGEGTERKLVAVINIKREHFNSAGERVFGYQQDVSDPDSLMMWDKDGNKTETAPDDIRIEVE